MHEDEFCLDPTRMTLVCGTAGFDGTQFKGLAGERVRHPAQQDLAQQRAAAVEHQQHARATSRTSIRVLVEISPRRSKSGLPARGESGACGLRRRG